MPMLNYIDQTYTVRITANEDPNVMQAVVDTAMAYTVLETDACSNCASDSDALAGTVLTVSAGNSVDSGTSVSGSFNNPSTSYSGTSGTTTICIFENGAYSTAPDAGNVAAMPCVDDMAVHFANTVTTTNPYATAYLGMALGKGPDFDGNTPTSTYLLMDQFEAAGNPDARLDSTTKKFAMAYATDDGNGLVEASTPSMAYFGDYDASSIYTQTPGKIQFNDNEFYWTAPLNGLRFGGTVSGAYALTDAEISIDTGRQCLYVPTE